MLRKVQKYSEAIDHLQAAIKLDPEDAANYNILAQVYMSTGKYPEAVKAYK